MINLRELYAGGDWNRQEAEWHRWGIKNTNALVGLVHLEYLNLSNNRLEDLSGLSGLNALQILHLNNNEIREAPSINKLKSLRELYLSNNFLKDVTFLGRMTWLETVDLHHNQINDASPLEALIRKLNLTNSKWEHGTINIAKNPLEIPSTSIIRLGKEAVLSNLKDFKTRDKYINKDLKVILIGNSEAGKSTMAKYLDAERGLHDPHPATHGMVEKIVQSKYDVARIGTKVDLHLFDFGGHDYYHDTHHLFFSHNTVFLLLWDKNTEKLKVRKMLQTNEKGVESQVSTQDYPVTYWLETVRFFTEDVKADNIDFKTAVEGSYNSSLLLIQNKVTKRDDIKPLNNEGLNTRFPFIYDFLQLSIREPQRNMDVFDRTFQEMLEEMEIIGEALPDFYGTIKNAVRHFTGRLSFSENEFLTYCNGLIGQPISLNQAIILARYLDQIGLIICRLIAGSWRICIDKAAVMRNIYLVLDGLTKNKGEFTVAEAVTKLDLRENDTLQIIELMIAFKLIFRHPGSKRSLFIAPLYLPEIPPASVSMFLRKDAAPYRRFEFTGYIHKHLLLSLFSEYGNLVGDPGTSASDNSFYWKDALIVKDPSNEEIVMIRFILGDDQGNARIDVYQLNTNQRPIFIEAIIKKIGELNNGYETEEMVSADGEHFVSLPVLRENATIGKWVFTEKRIADKAASKDPAPHIFHLKSFKPFVKDLIKKKSVVISYCKKDLDDGNTLIRFLRPLVTDGLIEEPWLCEHLDPAQEWGPDIQEQFEHADIVFFLVTSYLFVTKMVVEYEIPTIIDRYTRDKSVKIIPIVVDFCVWDTKGDYNLQRFSCLPFQGKPISDYATPSLAWAHICSAVRLMIEKDLDPENTSVVNRYWQEIFERQVSGKLDKNS